MPQVPGIEERHKRSRAEHQSSEVSQEQLPAKRPVLQKDVAKKAPGILIKEPVLKKPISAEAVKAPELKQLGITQAEPVAASATSSASKSTQQPTLETLSQAATVIEPTPAATATPRADRAHSATPASEPSLVVETSIVGGGERSADPSSKKTPPIVKEPKILMRKLRK